jgi:hypothetical protein
MEAREHTITLMCGEHAKTGEHDNHCSISGINNAWHWKEWYWKEYHQKK